MRPVLQLFTQLPQLLTKFLQLLSQIASVRFAARTETHLSVQFSSPARCCHRPFAASPVCSRAAASAFSARSR